MIVRLTRPASEFQLTWSPTLNLRIIVSLHDFSNGSTQKIGALMGIVRRFDPVVPLLP